MSGFHHVQPNEAEQTPDHVTPKDIVGLFDKLQGYHLLRSIDQPHRFCLSPVRIQPFTVVELTVLH